MLVTHDREKLVNTILYFAHNTKHLGKIKLFKLLFLLDFEHFRQTGQSVTGMDYHAWKFGPVPIKVMQEWEEFDADLAQAITIQPEKIIHHTRETVVPLAAFDDCHFTKRELRIMDKLAKRHCEARSPKMIDVVHAENGAWDKVWKGGHGNGNHIPYESSLSNDDPHRNAILEFAHEYQAIRKTHEMHHQHRR